MGWVQLQEKLSHPYKLTHKKLQIKMEDFFFCDGFPKGRRERENFQNFQGFFHNFFTLFSLFFFSFFFSLSFSYYFSQKIRGYLQESQERGRLCVVYHGTLYIASHFCHRIRLFCLFSSFWSKFCAAVWRPSELHFLQNIYFQKYLDVQFLLVLTLKDLELWLSRYRFWKEGYAMLKIL